MGLGKGARKEGDKERLRMHDEHMSISHDECSHYILQTYNIKNKIYKRFKGLLVVALEWAFTKLSGLILCVCVCS